MTTIRLATASDLDGAAELAMALGDSTSTDLTGVRTVDGD